MRLRLRECVEETPYPYRHKGIQDLQHQHTLACNDERTDYCGFVSGRHVDKGGLFTNSYGMLETAPMIEECPVNMECKVTAIIESLPTHDVFIGRIMETYCDKEYIVKGVLDFGRLNPILFVLSDACYWRLGKRIEKWGFPRKALKTDKA